MYEYIKYMYNVEDDTIKVSISHIYLKNHDNYL